MPQVGLAGLRGFSVYFSTPVDELHQYRSGILKESIHLLRKYLKENLAPAAYNSTITALCERANDCAIRCGIQCFATEGGFFDDDALKTGDRCFEVSKVRVCVRVRIMCIR